MKTLRILACSIALWIPFSSQAQVDEDQLGAWYMLFWNTTINESPWGFQGDIQHRNWNIIGDLQQLMLRGGLTYKPKDANVKFTLGYAYIGGGEFGESTTITGENRIYQEALLPHKVGKRFLLTHRFRYEQRFIEGREDMATRWRYNLFLNIPFKGETLGKGIWYLALYNEIFLNGEKVDLGNGRMVEIFGVNRTYGAIGVGVANNSRIQFGYMQQTTNSISKGQLQLSLHQKF